MTSMEKKLTENRLTEVKAALSAKYRTVDLGGENIFRCHRWSVLPSWCISRCDGAGD